MSATSSHRIAALLVVALLATGVPFVAAPRAAAISGVGDFTACAFVSSSVGVAVSAAGAIVRTADGGQTWTQVRPADGVPFVGVDFWDASSGVAVARDGRVYSSADSGLTWTAHGDMDGTAYDPNRPELSHQDVACQPGITGPGLAVAAAGDLDTTDENWIGPGAMYTYGELQWWHPDNWYQDKPHLWVPPEGEPAQVGEGEINDVEFVDGSLVWAGGIDTYSDQPTSVLLKSTNGGESWSHQASFNANVEIEGVAFSGAASGIVVGRSLETATLGQGRAYRTADGGATWTAGTLPATNALLAVEMSTPTQGWAVGAGGLVVRTTDGGATWTACAVPTGFSATLYDVEFRPGTTTGWAVGASGSVLMTTDGVNWSAPAAPDLTGPVMGPITSETHPVETDWYADGAPAFAWSASDPSGVAGYSYVLDTASGTTPDAAIDTTASGVAFSDLGDGVRYLHVRAVDTKGNWGAAVHRAVRIDRSAPTGTVTINGGAAKTSTTAVTLTLSGADGAGSGVTEMRISNDGVFDTEPWEPFATSRAWTLTAGDGTKSVFVHFRDALGHVSSTVSDTIVLESITLTTAAFAGTDRYATAILASRAAYADGSCGSVIVATGANYPDALSAAGLGGAARAPVLLVAGDRARADVVAEIKRLTRGRSSFTLYVMGGTAAVSADMESSLCRQLSGETVVRFAGHDRYETARLVAARVRALAGAAPKALLVTGAEFTDGLIVGPAAYATKAPILLARTYADAELVKTLKALGVRTLVVCGTTARIPASVESALRAAVPGLSVVRAASAADPYARAAEAAAYFTAPGSGFGLSWAGVGVATGEKFPDGLAAGCVEGAKRTPLMLTRTLALPAPTAAALAANEATIAQVRYYGGDAAVSPAVRTAVEAALK